MCFMIKTYIEFGIGNRWLLRTEYKLEDGTEFEKQGADFPKKLESLYVRVWIGKRVFIVDTKEGIKTGRKTRNAIKLIIGISGVG